MMMALALLEGAAIFAAALAAEWWCGSIESDARAVVTALVLATIAIGTLYFHDAYDARTARLIERRFVRCAFGVVAILTPIAVTLPSIWVPAVATVLGVITLVPLLRALCSTAVRSRPLARRVLILGSSPLALRLAEEITAREPWCRIVGVVAEGRIPVASSMPWPMVGSLERLDRIISETEPHRIIAALGERRGKLPVGPLLEAQLRGIRVEEGVDAYERLTGKLAIEWLTPSPLIFSPGFRRAPVTQALARATSLVASLIGLVVSAPLIALVALLVRIDSAGPVFFVQERVGQGGKVFKLIKFRTMHPAGGPRSEWARDNSDRITRVGRWLRKFRLDELPQLINVLHGDMNLVGPRPHPLSNFALFVTVLRNLPERCEQIPYYSLRLAVRPGVTGWAQVRYRYANDLEEEVEKTCYDLYYIKHLSLWLDLRILLDTVKTVLTGHGAGEVTEPAPSQPARPADVIRIPVADADARISDRAPMVPGRPRLVGALVDGARDREHAQR
jgi:exopolysaccharide biosynthesis polyprenyl glycosylphosphotransferase